MKICAGIVTYNPDINILKMNVKSIVNQVNFVVIVDNGSSNYKEIEKHFENITQVVLLPNSLNMGIAKALNQIMEYSCNHNIEWVLTLDQDTVSPKNVISEYAKYADSNTIGLLTSQVRDVNINKMLTKNDPENITVVDRCITSGALTNVKAWEKINGFNNEMFIDYVDFDFCTRLILNGYKILRVNGVCFEHSLGNCQIRKFLFLKVRVSNHSSFRKYYIARNMTYFIRKYKKQVDMKKEYLRFAKVVLFTILFEDNKREKLKSISKGIKDAKELI